MINKRRILLVDDETDFLDGTRRCLERAGYDVLTTSLGREAWDIVQSRDDVDLVLLDVNLPDLDGFSLCRRIRMDLRRCGLPVILVTVRRNPADVLGGFSSGATEYLAKPVRSDELLLQIRRFIGKPQDIRAS